MTRSAKFPLGFLAISGICAATGIAGIARSSDLLASASTSLLVIALIVATLHARFGSVPSRRFFWGFALAGWAYAIVSYGPLGAQLRGSLVTGVLIDRLMPPTPIDLRAAQFWQIDRGRWHLVGHVLFTLAIGLAGGLFATRIGERRECESDRPAA